MGAVQSALGLGGCGREIFVLDTSSLQFTKAGSTATLLQQEKNNSADVQRAAYSLSRRCAFGEFELLADSFAAGAPLR